MGYQKDVEKISQIDADGVNATPGSVSYEIEVNDMHIHGSEEWYGKDTTSRIITFVELAYVSCLTTDKGKPVVGSSTGDTGILISYNNTTRVWIVTPTDSGDTFASTETITITGGTGTGTTAGASSAGSGFLNRNSLVSWDIVAGTPLETYGTEVQIGNATIIAGGSATMFYDLHQIYVVDVNSFDKTFKIQFWYGTSTFSAATLLTEVPYRAASSATTCVPLIIRSPRIHCNNFLWARCMCATQGKQISFMLGLHTYVK